MALARTFALQPEVLLMYEPFAALVAQTRMTMQRLLLYISKTLKPSFILVTKDIEESLWELFQGAGR